MSGEFSSLPAAGPGNSEAGAPGGKLNILVLYALPGAMAETVRSSLKAVEAFSRHEIHYADTIAHGIEHLDLSMFDAVIMHYSVVCAFPLREIYLRDFERLLQFQGVKAAFIQDDYRWVNATVDALDALQVDILFTCVSHPDSLQVYDDPRLSRVRIVSVFAGYVDERLLHRAVPSYTRRRLDVGYRAQDLSGKFAWLGELAQEKKWIADRFMSDAAQFGLNVDISCDPSRRIYGEAWFDFISDCRAVLGSESGASVCDKTGEIKQAVEGYLAEHPTASFHEIRDACFPGQDQVTLVRSLSPRMFEAAALRTLMICYPGQYGGILHPWRHYVPLEKDHSNIPEVVAVLRDASRAGEIIDRAYHEIACNPDFHESSVVRSLDAEIERAFVAKGLSPVRKPVSRFDFQLSLERYASRLLEKSEQRIREVKAVVKSEQQWKIHFRSELRKHKNSQKEKRARSIRFRLAEKIRSFLRKLRS